MLIANTLICTYMSNMRINPFESQCLLHQSNCIWPLKQFVNFANNRSKAFTIKMLENIE
uniref:Uncharacterized protein n=1 Tax=Setaria italica TaxID=4555 RepID=K4AHV4_SETIT